MVVRSAISATNIPSDARLRELGGGSQLAYPVHSEGTKHFWNTVGTRQTGVRQLTLPHPPDTASSAHSNQMAGARQLKACPITDCARVDTSLEDWLQGLGCFPSNCDVAVPG